MKSKSIIHIKNFKVIFLIPLLIVILYICAVRYSEYLTQQEREIETRIRKEEIWAENIRKILISDSYREKIQDCFRCSIAGGHLSSEGNICVVESGCGCTPPAVCDCMGAMRYTMKELQKWYPEVSRLQKLGKEDIDRCFH